MLKPAKLSTTVEALIVVLLQMGCALKYTCGNGQLDPGEQCEDGLDIIETCQTLEQGYGSLSCTEDCRYDFSNCDTGSVQFTINHEISSAIGTVGIVTWSTTLSPVSEAYVEFGVDTDYGMKAPVDLDEPEYRTLLLGLKGSQDYHFRVVANSRGTQYKSPDYTLTTGPVTNLAQIMEMDIYDEKARDRGFIVTSLYEDGLLISGGPLAFIVDADGDIVWWYKSNLSSVSRARMSYDGKNMWMVTIGMDFFNDIERVTMDGLDSQIYKIPATHDITPVKGDVMAFPEGGFATCATIKEITPDGTTRRVFDTNELWQGEICHANAIRYSESENVYTLSNTGSIPDIIWVDRASGKLKQRLSDYGFFWGSVQHGHHLLSNSILIFNNAAVITQEILLDPYGMRALEVFRYGSDYFSYALGDVQRLPNGNTLVTYSTAGRIHEVDPKANLIMEMRTNKTIGYAVWRKSLYGPPPDITF